MQNLITLQLTVPALEKLLDGDPVFALSLKKAVIAEAISRGVRAKLDGTLKTEIEDAIKRHIGTYKYGVGGTLSAELLAKVKEVAMEVVSTVQREAITAARQCATEEAQQQASIIEQTVKNRVAAEIGRQIQTEIERRVKERMDAIKKAAEG